jgi:hypothetical protein
MKKMILALLMGGVGVALAQAPPNPFNPPTFIGTSTPLTCQNGSLFFNSSTYHWLTCGPNNTWGTTNVVPISLTNVSANIGVTNTSITCNATTYCQYFVVTAMDCNQANAGTATGSLALNIIFPINTSGGTISNNSTLTLNLASGCGATSSISKTIMVAAGGNIQYSLTGTITGAFSIDAGISFLLLQNK